MSNARFSILQARAVKDKRISDAQFRTLAALGMYADEDGWCFPRLSTIGSDLGKSKQAVGRDTIALRNLGYLEVTARYNENGGRKSNLYRLKFDLPRQRDVDTPSTTDVDTPSTTDVDTPSTTDVDVNVPYNDTKNDPNKYVVRRKKNSKKTDEVKSQYSAGTNTLQSFDFENMTITEAHQVPTIKMFHRATKFFPGAPLWEYVHEFLTNNEISEDKLRETAILWRASGYRMQNIKGLLEAARDGFEDRRYGNGHKPAQAQSQPAPGFPTFVDGKVVMPGE